MDEIIAMRNSLDFVENISTDGCGRAVIFLTTGQSDHLDDDAHVCRTMKRY